MAAARTALGPKIRTYHILRREFYCASQQNGRADVRLGSILLKNQKSEWRQNLALLPSNTAVGTRMPCNEFRRPASWKLDWSRVPPYSFRTNAPAPLENFVHLKKSTFSTASARSGHRGEQAFGRIRYENLPHARSVIHQMIRLPRTTRIPRVSHPYMLVEIAPEPSASTGRIIAR